LLDVRKTEEMCPFSDCGTDLWQEGNDDFLVLVDRFSGYVLCKKVRNKTSAAVISQLTEWMSSYHPILRLRSDGGPAYKSREFSEFCETFGIVHEMSSSYFPSSDGMAECGVNVCKRLQRKSREEGSNFLANLQCLNNYPRKSPPGCPVIASPAEMFFGTGQRDYNPRLGSNEPDLAMSAIAREKQRAIMRERSHRSNVSMTPFARGDLVWIQDPESKYWDQQGRILAVRPSGMSYHVQKLNGKVSKRNRKFLKIRQAAQTDEEIDIESAAILIVESRFSQSAQARRESCLHRPTDCATWGSGRTCRAKQRVSFGSATWVQAVTGRDGAPVSVSTSVQLAQRVTRLFKPLVAGG
jgi:hypothetical protein